MLKKYTKQEIKEIVKAEPLLFLNAGLLSNDEENSHIFSVDKLKLCEMQGKLFRAARADYCKDKTLEIVATQEQKLQSWKQKVKDISVDAGHLEDWYIHSVFENQWDLSQVKELARDFYCIPKCVIDEEKIN